MHPFHRPRFHEPPPRPPATPPALRLRRWVAVGLAMTAVTAGAVAASPAAQAAPAFKVLIFSKTGGYRHDSIPAGIQMIRDLGAANDFAVDATEDDSLFTETNLAQYQAVIWLSTTGPVLTGGERAAFESYIASGGGYVGIHAAADTEYGWPWYGGLVGAYFLSHPEQQTATIHVEDRTHPATQHLGATWTRFDEWYNYQANPRPDVHVLATLDESTYSGGSMGADHPIAWCHPFQGGRAFYTGLGHTTESYAEPDFRAHVLGAVRWAAGVAPGDCGPGGPSPTPTPSATPTPTPTPTPSDSPTPTPSATPSPTPSGEATLLSGGRPADASSVEAGGLDAANVTDGNPGTRWSSQFADPQWVRIDLGQQRQVSRVRLSWESAYASAYDVQVSDTGADGTWTTVAGTTSGDGGIDDLSFAPAGARYVRVLGTARATIWGYSLYEVEVYGS